jgi:diguanylate cyclase (GGDEF)-like protein
MSLAMKRNVQVVVASLDYLADLRSAVFSPTVIAEAHMAQIVNLSMRDGLTGFFNHTSCFEILDMELGKYARHGTVVSLIMTDVDDFKAINDQYGHPEGDRILTELAVAVEEGTRESDIRCRYGGEELATILPLTDARVAAHVAERIREAVTQIQAGSHALSITSGVASCSEDTTTAAALVNKADRALLQGKRDGKNCVVVS